MKLLPLFSLSAIALASIISTAHAGDLSYNYIEGGYSKYNIDEVDSAFTVGGSYGVTNNINIIGSYSTTDIKTDGTADINMNQYEVGVGYHFPISDETDLTADVSYLSVEAEASQGGVTISGSESGYGVGVGVRHQLTDSIEAKARVSYADIKDNSEMALTVGGRYNINEALSAGVDLTTVTDEGPEVITTSLRWNFL